MFYDMGSIAEEARQADMEPVISPKKSRTVQCEYDKRIYRQRHRVENAFLKLKHWRGITTRYVKNAASSLAAIHIRCLVLWLSIS